MCTEQSDRASGLAFDSPAAAVRAARAALGYLGSCAASLDGAGCGELLIAAGELQGRLTAAHAALLHRFDAARAHQADGYRSASAWLTGKGGMSASGARSAVREMRQLRERPHLEDALAAGDVTGSLEFTIASWAGDLPADLRGETERILLDAARSGASLDDLRVIAGYAREKWRQQHPDADDPGPDDRSLSLGTTFGGAGVIRGDLTPECAAAVQAVLDALGKKQGPQDERTERQRYHDALQLACTLLLRARLVPGRAGADTQAIVHIPFSQLRQLPGADGLEDSWLRARLSDHDNGASSGSGDGAYLTGTDATAAACDAQVTPVVTGTLHLDVVDKIIALARAGAGSVPASDSAGAGSVSADAPLPGSPEARQALRYAIARLALDLVAGPGGLAATLRTRLLDKPYSSPSLALDIGRSRGIPGHIRRGVQLRDRHFAWPGCEQPPARCDVHHIRHQAHGGETSLSNCVLLCQFHHDHLIHRQGWTLVLHPDGTTTARSPDGHTTLYSHAPRHSHAPPAASAA